MSIQEIIDELILELNITNPDLEYCLKMICDIKQALSEDTKTGWSPIHNKVQRNEYKEVLDTLKRIEQKINEPKQGEGYLTGKKYVIGSP